MESNVIINAPSAIANMGGMSLDQYVYYIAFLGVICGLVFVLGLNQ